MKAVYKNELKSYFTGVTGYVFTAFMLFFAGMYTMALCLKQGYAQFEYVFGNLSFIFLIIIPVITMRVLSEERRQKTDQLLYSLPISTTEVVLGKYLALVTVLLIPLAIMAFYPLVLSIYGTIHFPSAYTALIAFFFMGAAFLAIGLFISSVTESQMVAAGLCFLVLLMNYYLSNLSSMISVAAYVSLIVVIAVLLALGLILYLMTKDMFISAVIAAVLCFAAFILYKTKPSFYEGLVPSVLEKLSLFERYYTFMSGSFDLTQIVFFLSVSALFVFLSVQSLEKRRWS